MTYKIAIIDDDSMLTSYYIDALNEMGFETDFYKSPASCLTALASKKKI